MSDKLNLITRPAYFYCVEDSKCPVQTDLAAINFFQTLKEYAVVTT